MEEGWGSAFCPSLPLPPGDANALAQGHALGSKATIGHHHIQRSTQMPWFYELVQAHFPSHSQPAPGAPQNHSVSLVSFLFALLNVFSLARWPLQIVFNTHSPFPTHPQPARLLPTLEDAAQWKFWWSRLSGRINYSLLKISLNGWILKCLFPSPDMWSLPASFMFVFGVCFMPNINKCLSSWHALGKFKSLLEC